MTKQDPAEPDAGQGTIDKVADRMTAAYSSARGAASEAVHSTALNIDTNPFAAVLGGLALGAIAGALIPRAAREIELLEPIGARFGEAARAAIEAGRAAGTNALADAGFSTDNLRTQVSRLIGEALSAAGSAGTAAFGAARDAAAR